jgi:hypothetical protein
MKWLFPIFASLALAADAPERVLDFSGTWKLVPERSAPRFTIGRQLVIEHDDPAILIKDTVIQPNSEVTREVRLEVVAKMVKGQTLTLPLDKCSYIAEWRPKTLRVDGDCAVDDIEAWSAEEWYLSEDGQTLTLFMPKNSFKAVFQRQAVEVKKPEIANQ